jgi:hypothetical protein
MGVEEPHSAISVGSNIFKYASLGWESAIDVVSRAITLGIAHQRLLGVKGFREAVFSLDSMLKL